MGCCFEKYIPIKLVVAHFSLSRKQSCEGKTECQATNLGAVNVPFKWPNPYTLQEHVHTHTYMPEFDACISKSETIKCSDSIYI